MTDQSSDVSTIALSLDRAMRQISAALNVRAHEFDPKGIGQLGGMVLLTLNQSQPAPIQSLVTRLGRDKSQVTRLVAMLEREGLIERRACASDGRVSLISLTADGASFVGDIQTAVIAVVNDLLDPLDSPERKTLAHLLSKL